MWKFIAFALDLDPPGLSWEQGSDFIQSWLSPRPSMCVFFFVALSKYIFSLWQKHTWNAKFCSSSRNFGGQFHERVKFSLSCCHLEWNRADISPDNSPNLKCVLVRAQFFLNFTRYTRFSIEEIHIFAVSEKRNVVRNSLFADKNCILNIFQSDKKSFFSYFELFLSISSFFLSKMTLKISRFLHCESYLAKISMA